MLDPSPAPVRPRVIAERSRGVVLLEDLVEEIAAAGNVACLQLYGPPGAGLTTALRHLQWVFGSQSGFTFVDLDFPATVFEQRAAGMIGLPQGNSRCDGILKCKLASWERDEWIEYLLAVHKPRCPSVMKRLQADPLAGSLLGHPALCSQVLDLLATEENLTSARDAIIRIIDAQFPDVEARREISCLIYAGLTRDPEAPQEVAVPMEWFSPAQLRLIHIPVIRMLLASDAAWEQVQQQHAKLSHWPRELVHEIAARVSESADLQEDLQERLTNQHQQSHPVLLSLLHGAQVPLRQILPQQAGLFRTSLRLDGAFLDQADCSELVISKCSMIGTSFSAADFTRAVLQGINAERADFGHACLLDAKLSHFNGAGANFAAADLTRLQGEQVIWNRASLASAHLTEAHLEDSRFLGADLSNAICRSASFHRCHFTNARLEEADFRDADLSYAILSELDLTGARFDRANFQGAHMVRCCLEGMELADAEFHRANLHDAIFTDSIMPLADFSQAILFGAKLANVDWEGANLRGADLTNATFHMGSSRSGLVGSSIASYGSRTGFYTDELHEQDFKAPEEIRKANLRGADLRGARIDNVDFYLVDLRDALFDPKHEEQLRRTGAILCNKG